MHRKLIQNGLEQYTGVATRTAGGINERAVEMSEDLKNNACFAS